MAGFNTPQLARTPSSQQPKEMSSRLLNMKFMQRATAVSPATSTPTSATPQTPATEPSAKRRRIESATSSPSISVPGTPTYDTVNGLGTTTTARGGVSTFTRTGADTEWVLDVKLPSSQDKLSRLAKTSSQTTKVNGSVSRFNALAHRDDEVEDDSGGEDDIWDTAQPSGRQTFGSFKKRKSRSTTQQARTNDDNEQDLSSASGSDDSSNPGKASDSEDDLDSDEEMRHVRRAIEQKHRSMQGGGPAGRSAQSAFSRTGQAGGGSQFDKGQRGQKRKGREEGSYKQKKKAKKARKTI